jgi:hypothetical protein
LREESKLMVLRRKFGPKREKIKESGEKYIMRS